MGRKGLTDEQRARKARRVVNAAAVSDARHAAEKEASEALWAMSPSGQLEKNLAERAEAVAHLAKREAAPEAAASRRASQPRAAKTEAAHAAAAAAAVAAAAATMDSDMEEDDPEEEGDSDDDGGPPQKVRAAVSCHHDTTATHPPSSYPLLSHSQQARVGSGFKKVRAIEPLCPQLHLTPSSSLPQATPRTNVAPAVGATASSLPRKRPRAADVRQGGSLSLFHCLTLTQPTPLPPTANGTPRCGGGG